MISFWLEGLEMDGAGVSISKGVSLSRAGPLGSGISGIKAGGGLKSGKAGIMEDGEISNEALESGKVGMFGSRAFGEEISASGGESPKSEGTGISGAGPGTSELVLSRMGSARTSTESLLIDFLKPRKPFLFSVAALGGGEAGTSGSFFSLLFSFFCF